MGGGLSKKPLVSNVSAAAPTDDVGAYLIGDTKPSDLTALSAGIGMSGGGSKSWFDMLFAKYIPFMVRERFRYDHRKLMTPELEKFDGAVAFVDISGFTKLSEKLVKEHGTAGAEMLNKYISGYFKKLIDVIVDFGGDIIKFAGDAMLVVWRNKREPPAGKGLFKRDIDGNKTASTKQHNLYSTKQQKDLTSVFGSQQEPLASLVLRAVACNLHLLKKFNNFQPTPGAVLTLHTGIGAGSLFGLFVGGVQGLWEFFIAGDPIQMMSEACEQAKAGEVVLHSSAHALVKHAVIGKRLSSGNYKMESLMDPPRIFKAPPPPISPAVEESLEGFIPQVVKKRLDSGQSSAWLAEFRKVYVMFIALPDIDYHQANVLSTLQACVQVVQEAVLRYEGTIARLLADDKGTRFKIAFGMPTLAHEDDAVRVVKAALEIEKQLRKHDARSAIGIAHGTCYCGEAGSSTRCEYTAVGFKVIMAARLTQAARDVGILCDEDTMRAAEYQSHAVTFEPRPPMKLKGLENAVPIWRPHLMQKAGDKSAKLLGIDDEKKGHAHRDVMRLARAGTTVSLTGNQNAPSTTLNTATTQHIDTSVSGSFVAPPLSAVGTGTASGAGTTSSSTTAVVSLPPLAPPPLPGSSGEETKAKKKRSLASQRFQSIIGRKKEKELLVGLVRRVVETGETQIVMIESEGGLGKSAFVYDFLNVVEQMQIEFFYGAGDQTEKRTPYYGWRTIFEQLTGLEGMKNAKKRSKFLMNFLSEDLQPWAVLLNPILGTTFDETDFTKQMTTESRAKNLQRLLVAILGETAKRVERTGLIQTRVIVLEDLHWIDSGSWELAVDVCKLLPNLIVIFTTRPLNKIIHLSKIMRMNTQKIVLAELSKPESLQLAAQKLGLSATSAALPPALQHIIERAQGHPLFIEEMCRTMLEEALISVDAAGKLVVSEKLAKQSAEAQSGGLLSESLQTVIMGRIDRLPNEAQLTLKVCAVIGLEIRLKVLRQVHPLSSNKKQLRKEMNYLVQSGLLIDDTGERDLFSFRHLYFQEAAYKMLSLDQRKDIHDLIAQFYESAYKGKDLEQYFGVVAHHYHRAEKWSKTLHYSALAGVGALSVNANHEAVKMFEVVSEILSKHKSVLAQTGEFNLEKQLLDVHANLGSAYYAMGRYPLCSVHLTIALNKLNYRISANNQWIFLQLLQRGLKYFFGRRRVDYSGITAEDLMPLTESDESAMRKAVLLLEKLARACVLSGLSWRASYCAFKMADVAEALGDPALLALGYSQCAAACLELKWVKLAEIFVNKTRATIQNAPSIPQLERARISYQDSFMYAYSGQWLYALQLLSQAKETFARLSENKKWREAAFMEGIVLYFMTKYRESIACFQTLTESAVADGDLYFESSGLYWKSLLLFTIEGSHAADEIRQNMSATATMADDLNLSSSYSLSHLVLQVYNDFLVKPNFSTVLSLANRHLKYLGVPPNLIQQCPVHVNFVSLLLYAASLPVVAAQLPRLSAFPCLPRAAGSDGTPTSTSASASPLLAAATHSMLTAGIRKKLLKLASKALDKLWSFCRSFPYAMAYALLLQGKYYLLLGERKAALKNFRQAAMEGKKNHMYFVVAQANYELGVHLMANKVAGVAGAGNGAASTSGAGGSTGAGGVPNKDGMLQKKDDPLTPMKNAAAAAGGPSVPGAASEHSRSARKGSTSGKDEYLLRALMSFQKMGIRYQHHVEFAALHQYFLEAGAAHSEDEDEKKHAFHIGDFAADSHRERDRPMNAYATHEMDGMAAGGGGAGGGGALLGYGYGSASSDHGHVGAAMHYHVSGPQQQTLTYERGGFPGNSGAAARVPSGYALHEHEADDESHELSEDEENKSFLHGSAPSSFAHVGLPPLGGGAAAGRTAGPQRKQIHGGAALPGGVASVGASANLSPIVSFAGRAQLQGDAVLSTGSSPLVGGGRQLAVFGSPQSSTPRNMDVLLGPLKRHGKLAPIDKSPASSPSLQSISTLADREKRNSGGSLQMVSVTAAPGRTARVSVEDDQKIPKSANGNGNGGSNSGSGTGTPLKERVLLPTIDAPATHSANVTDSVATTPAAGYTQSQQAVNFHVEASISDGNRFIHQQQGYTDDTAEDVKLPLIHVAQDDSASDATAITSAADVLTQTAVLPSASAQQHLPNVSELAKAVASLPPLPPSASTNTNPPATNPATSIALANQTHPLLSALPMAIPRPQSQVQSQSHSHSHSNSHSLAHQQPPQPQLQAQQQQQSTTNPSNAPSSSSVTSKDGSLAGSVMNSVTTGTKSASATPSPAVLPSSANNNSVHLVQLPVNTRSG